MALCGWRWSFSTKPRDEGANCGGPPRRRTGSPGGRREKRASCWKWKLRAIAHLEVAGAAAEPARRSARWRDRACRSPTCRGRSAWRLGGSASDFKPWQWRELPLPTRRPLSGGHRVSLFDDEAGPPAQFAPSSRGLVLKLHRHPRTRPRWSTPIAAGRHVGPERGQRADPARRLRVRRLSLAVLQPVLTARPAAARRQPARRRRLPARDYRFPWNAKPKTAPAAAVARTDRRTRSCTRAGARSPAGACGGDSADALARRDRHRQLASRPDPGSSSATSLPAVRA